MQVYFDNDRFEKVLCRDTKERYVGGIQVTPEVWETINSIDLDWDKLPEESSEYDLVIGNVVGVYLEEVGPQPVPYVVANVEEDPDTEDYSRIIVLENESREDIQNIGVGCGMRGTQADYEHTETSRYIAGDGVTISIVPDLILADLLDSEELKSHITSSVI